MDWSRRNSSGAVAHPNNQQYLPQSTSSTVPTISSHMAYVPPNAYNPAETFVTKSCNALLLKGLLGAKSNEEMLKIQQCALLKTPVQQTMQVSAGQQTMQVSAGQQTMQVSPGQYSSSYNALHKTTAATNHQSSLNVQNPVGSNFPTQFYPNRVLQTVQQAQPAPVVQQQAQPAPMVQQQTYPAPVVQQQVQSGQCYGANGHNSREVQQSLQSSQSGGYSHKKAYRQMSNSYAAKHSRNVQMGYQTIMPKQNSVAMNSVSSGSCAQNAVSYKGLNDKNVPVLSTNYQYGQNIQNQMGSNSQTLTLTNMLQPKQDMNGPSPQKQMIPNLHSGFPNNPNILPSGTVGQAPPVFSQSNTNVSNVSNVTVNQQFSNANQNFVAQNGQQLAQSYTVPQDPHSESAQPPPYGGHVPQDQRLNVPDILALLQVYQNVKQKYLLLNRENNLLRQKMQNSSQSNSGSCTVRPPLISTLSTSTDPTIDLRGEQVSQNSTLQSQPPSNTTHGVQAPSLYDASVNVPVQDITQPSNYLSNCVYPANNRDVVGNQRNYSSQINVQNSTNTYEQAIGSETLRVQDPKENATVSIQSNNQYHSRANSSNGNLSQNRLYITSNQNLGHMTPASSESCNLDHTTNVNNFYANKPLSSNSREAIKASLPLWKSVPPSSTPTKSDSESRHHIVNSLDSVHLLQEIASSPINEPPVTLAQKPEHVSKGNERQVGVVPPLVQIKELVNELNQLPKIVQGEVVTSNRVNGLKENDCFRKLHPPFESVDTTAVMNSLDDAQTRSNVISSSPSKADQNYTENVDTVDENLQISGICTLVKGNSLYDSSIAMMFEGSLQIQPDSQLAINDPKDDFTLQCSQEVFNICDASQATGCVSPTETEAIKSETSSPFKSSVNIEDNQQAANDCLGSQSEQNLSVSDVFDLESNTASDQLSELLTEFPFGIKNYMSENDHDSIAISLPKLKEKREIPQPSISLCGSKSDGSIEDTQTECAVDTLPKEMGSEGTEVIEQHMSVPTPELPSDGETSVQLEDDGFEICDSPDSNIHITLLDQDEIPKLFPEDSCKPIQHNVESSVEPFVKESKALVDVAVSSIKEKEEETTSVPDKELFCCLFSWLTHTNGNAPKCNCKLTELEETQGLSNTFSQHTAVVKNEPLTDSLDTPTDSPKPSSPSPFKMQPNEIKNEEMLPQVSKYPKLEPIKISLESKHGPCIINSSSREEIQPKLDLGKKNVEDQSLKELIKNDTLTSENILQPKDQLQDPNTNGAQDPFLSCKLKVDPGKSEKLIIKTDFLKNKHLLKMKRKYKEMKAARVEEGVARNVHKIYKNTKVGDSVKARNVDLIIGDEANNLKCKLSASIVQPSESSLNKLKSSSSLDKSHYRNKARSPGKCKDRVKNRHESHYEKVKKVPTVQEYLERKRELCNKRQEPKVDESPKVRHRVAERNENSLLAKLLIPPVKINVKTKNTESEANYQAQKGQPKTSGVYKPLQKRHRDPASSHGKTPLINRGFDQKTTCSKEKIYLSPLDGSRQTSYEGISLTKLQIRHSPEKNGCFERRQSLDSSVHSKKSKSDQSHAKKGETPKMLEFKLCPEFGNRSPSTQEKKGELKAAKEKSVVEGIKSKKEAWCSGGPFKKSRMDTSFEDHGRQSPSLLSAFKSAQKNLRPVQDSQTTFNVFRQMYHEKRSKSLDSSL